MRPRRALLYMPGDDIHKIRKATTLGVDCICMDMEDGVAISQKSKARDTIVTALATLDFGNTEKLVRINPVGSGIEGEDVQAVIPAHPAGIVVPKVESVNQLLWVNDEISGYERTNGWPSEQIALIAIIETARGIINLKEIAGSVPRLQALIFGAEDLAGDIGAIRTVDGWEVYYARSAVVTFAAAFDLQAIDMVYTNFQDTQGLLRESAQGVQLGYSGKQIIHPNQVGPVQEAFTPADAAIAQALHVIKANEEYQKAGTGAFALDGKMIDAPVVKSARRVLERARAAGKVP